MDCLSKAHSKTSPHRFSSFTRVFHFNPLSSAIDKADIPKGCSGFFELRSNGIESGFALLIFCITKNRFPLALPVKIYLDSLFLYTTPRCSTQATKIVFFSFS